MLQARLLQHCKCMQTFTSRLIPAGCLILPFSNLPSETKARCVSQGSKPSKICVAYRIVAPLESHSSLHHTLCTTALQLQSSQLATCSYTERRSDLICMQSSQQLRIAGTTTLSRAQCVVSLTAGTPANPSVPQHPCQQSLHQAIAPATTE